MASRGGYSHKEGRPKRTHVKVYENAPASDVGVQGVFRLARLLD